MKKKHVDFSLLPFAIVLFFSNFRAHYGYTLEQEVTFSKDQGYTYYTSQTVATLLGLTGDEAIFAQLQDPAFRILLVFFCICF